MAGLLSAAGWRQAYVWECAVRGRGRATPDELAADIIAWLDPSRPTTHLRSSELLSRRLTSGAFVRGRS